MFDILEGDALAKIAWRIGRPELHRHRRAV